MGDGQNQEIIDFLNDENTKMNANRKGIRPDQINARFFGEYLDNMRNTMQADSGEDGHLSCSSAPARPSVRVKRKVRRRAKCKRASTNSSKLRGKLIQAKTQMNTLYLRIKGLQKSLKASEKLCRKQASEIVLKRNQAQKAKQLADLYKRKCILVENSRARERRNRGPEFTVANVNKIKKLFKTSESENSALRSRLQQLLNMSTLMQKRLIKAEKASTTFSEQNEYLKKKLQTLDQERARLEEEKNLFNSRYQLERHQHMQLQEKMLQREHLENKQKQKRFYEKIHSMREKQEELIDTEPPWHQRRQHQSQILSPSTTDITLESEPLKDNVDIESPSLCSTPDTDLLRSRPHIAPDTDLLGSRPHIAPDTNLLIPRPNIFRGAASSAFMPTPIQESRHLAKEEEESLAKDEEEEPSRPDTSSKQMDPVTTTTMLTPLSDRESETESESHSSDPEVSTSSLRNNDHMTPPRSNDKKKYIKHHTPKARTWESERTKSAKNKYNWLKSTYDRVYKTQKL